MRRGSLPLAVLALLALLAVPAVAGRTLDEPKGVKELVKKTPAVVAGDALTKAGVKERCGDAVMRAADLNGLGCRLVVHSHAASSSSLATPNDVATRVAAAKDAWLAAASIASFEPLTKSPRLAEDRAFAHRRACDTLLEAWDALRAVPRAGAPELVAAVDDALKAPLDGDKPLGDAACACTAQTLDFASSAEAGVETIGALQGALTSRGCFLDPSKIRAEKGGPKSSFSGEAAKVSAASTDEALLVDYAKTRDVGLARCRDKFLGGGAGKGALLGDKEGMHKCVCGEIERWAFPKKRERPELTVRIPVYQDRLLVDVKVSAPGKVLECGALSGPLLQ